MTNLPPGWVFATLSDLASLEPRSITDGPFGSNLKTSHYAASGPRVIRLQNIGNFKFNDDRAHISQEHFQSLRTHEVQPSDVLIAGLGEQLPRACLAPPWLGQAIVKADCSVSGCTRVSLRITSALSSIPHKCVLQPLNG